MPSRLEVLRELEVEQTRTQCFLELGSKRPVSMSILDKSLCGRHRHLCRERYFSVSFDDYSRVIHDNSERHLSGMVFFTD